MSTIFILNAFCTFSLFGLIWTIQLVHYPSFHFVDEKKFTDFENFHSKRITYVVLPLMVSELLSSIALIFTSPQSLILYTNLILVLLIWISTFALSVPSHNKLMKNKNKNVIDTLVNTNWVRTICWSLKSLLVLSLLISYRRV